MRVQCQLASAPKTTLCVEGKVEPIRESRYRECAQAETDRQGHKPLHNTSNNNNKVTLHNNNNYKEICINNLRTFRRPFSGTCRGERAREETPPRLAKTPYTLPCFSLPLYLLLFPLSLSFSLPLCVF